MRILITGSRAPAALELVRNFGLCGWEVYAADSIDAAIARYSAYVKRFFTVHAPRSDERAFVDDLCDIVRKHGIDVVFPTCEEIFWIAKNLAEIRARCRAQIICEPLEKLDVLHNKYKFIRFAKGLGIAVPDTHLIAENVPIAQTNAQKEQKIVLKPVYSRFGEDVIVAEPSDIAFDGLHGKWIAQEFIEGEPVCSYGYAENGVLKFNICYRSPVRARTFTAFAPFVCGAVTKMVQTIAEALCFTGNLSFDFIRRGDAYIPIECNPRITSGIHTLRGNAFDALFFGTLKQPQLDFAQLRLPTLLTGGGWLPYRDVIWNSNDKRPFFNQARCLWAFHTLAKRHGVSLTKAMTIDIAWNGEDISNGLDAER